ncbi:MAG: GPW/gp25 family protein [Gammaproteobacteria bacterium]
MSATDARFGTDLRLLPDLAQVKSSRDPGHDLSTLKRPETGRVDLESLTGTDNLVQALLLRFLTPVGELAVLGHPSYGTRLAELIGELNNETNRNRAKLFVLQALADEPRVRQVLSVKVTQSRSDRTRMDIEITLMAVDSDTPLNLVFPFFLEGGNGV